MKVNNPKEIKQLLTDVIDFFNSIDNEINELNKQLNIKEGEQEDLLHEFEMAKLNGIEMMKVSKSMITTRKERRKIKDNLELLKTLKPLANMYYTKGMNAEILQTIKNIETLESNWTSRKYTPRVLNNLKCAEVHNEI